MDTVTARGDFFNLDAIGRATGEANLTGKPIPGSKPPVPPQDRAPMTELEWAVQTFNEDMAERSTRVGVLNGLIQRDLTLGTKRPMIDLVIEAGMVHDFVWNDQRPDRPTATVAPFPVPSSTGEAKEGSQTPLPPGYSYGPNDIVLANVADAARAGLIPPVPILNPVVVENNIVKSVKLVAEPLDQPLEDKP